MKHVLITTFALLTLISSSVLANINDGLVATTVSFKPHEDIASVTLRNDYDYDLICNIILSAKVVGTDGYETVVSSSSVEQQVVRVSRSVSIEFNFKRPMKRIRRDWNDEYARIKVIDRDDLESSCRKYGDRDPDPYPYPDPDPDTCREGRKALSLMGIYTRNAGKASSTESYCIELAKAKRAQLDAELRGHDSCLRSGNKREFERLSLYIDMAMKSSCDWMIKL